MTMRDSLICRCGARRIYEVEGARLRRFGGDLTLPVARRREADAATAPASARAASWRSEGYGQWRVFACAGCGAVEWYVNFSLPADALADSVARVCACRHGLAWRVPTQLGGRIWEVTACGGCGLATWRWLDVVRSDGACAHPHTVHADVPQLGAHFSVAACDRCGRVEWAVRHLGGVRRDTRLGVVLHEPTTEGPYR